MTEDAFTLTPVGFVRSALKDRRLAPRQGREGGPHAWIDIEPAYLAALDGIAAGDEVILLTWFHEADREVLKVHPRSDPQRRLTGVFATRSPDRPNPIGLHLVSVLAIEGSSLHVEPLEAIDGTPVVDIKPVLPGQEDA